MVTIVTDIQLKDGAEQEWDSIMKERMAAAKTRPGYVSGQVLSSDDKPHGRLIVGTWQSRTDWEDWHRDPLFAETREHLDDLVAGPAEHSSWHDVLVHEGSDGHAAGGTRRGSAARSTRKRKDR